MTPIQGKSFVSCPNCGHERHGFQTEITTSYVTRLDGGMSRWTKCGYCGCMSREIYDYEAHHFRLNDVIRFRS